MDYELHCVGFPTDDELKDRLLLSARRLLTQMAVNVPVRMTVKQIDGYVQSRVDLTLESRRLSSFVRRKDPVESLKAALKAMEDAIASDVYLDATGTED